MWRMALTQRSILVITFLVTSALLLGCGAKTKTKDSGASAEGVSDSSGTSDSPSASNPPDAATSTDTEGTKISIPDGQLGLQKISPNEGAIQRALTSTIVIEFNEPVLAESFNSDLIMLMAGRQKMTGSLTRPTSSRFEFTPNTLLPADTQLTVMVSAQVMSESGLSGTTKTWSFSTVANLGETSQATIDSCMSARDIAMLASVNKARSASRACGQDQMSAVGPLQWDCTVAESAQIHSDDMGRNNFFDHDGSDGSSAGDRLARVGYRFRSWGENIAAGQRDVDSVMRGWLDSPGHCRNIMSPRQAEFGLGYAEGANTEYSRYWTQVFATPE